jgi:two-component system, cell cycle response regulator
MQAPGSILVVDDRESNRHLTKEILQSAGHRVVCASDGAQAIDLAISTQPDMILMDVKMPGMDGFEVAAKLQSLAETTTIPIMFVTAHYAEEQDVLHGLGIGAYDYLIKPIPRAVLLARIDVILRVRRSEQRCRQLSLIDEFTGLFSRAYLVQRLAEEIERAERRAMPLTVTLLDLDDFKSCNQVFGHLFGDEVLKRVSTVLRKSARVADAVGRFAGEEFLIVHPESTEPEAVAAIERLKDEVARERFYGEAQELRVTLSAGIAAWDRHANTEALLGLARRALDAAKAGGKHQTVCYSQIAREPASAGSSN